MSSLAAVAALRKAGAEVLGMTAIFTYGFDLAAERFAESKVTLDTLSNYHALIAEARSRGLVNEEQADVLRAWRRSPAEWGQNQSV